MKYTGGASIRTALLIATKSLGSIYFLRITEITYEYLFENSVICVTYTHAVFYAFRKLCL